MLVVDASAVLEVLLRSPNAIGVEARIFAPGEVLVAPWLIDAEVAQVLRRYNLAGELDSRRGEEALTDFRDISLTKYAHDFLLPRVWELRHTLTAYDALYVSLAEVVNAPLITRDLRLSRSSGHAATIELV